MDTGKTPRDRAMGFTATNRLQESVDRILRRVRGLKKLLPIGAFTEHGIGRIARGLDSQVLDFLCEIASACTGLFGPSDTASAAAAKLAIGLHDPFSRYGAASSAIEEAIGKIGANVSL